MGWSRIPSDHGPVPGPDFGRRAHDALRSDPAPGTYSWQNYTDGPVNRYTVPTRWLPYAATTRRDRRRRKVHHIRAVKIAWPNHITPEPRLLVQGWCGITLTDPAMSDTPDLGEPCRVCVAKARPGPH